MQPSNGAEKDTARPVFFRDAVQDMAASERENRPIFVEKEFVRVHIPGDKLFNFVSEVEDKHRQRWPEYYDAFKRNEAIATSGTPIEHWPNAKLTKGRVAELKALHILSVEDLANVPDNTLGKIGMDARELREGARAYLQSAKGSAETAKMTAEIARLTEMVNTLMANKAPGGGDGVKATTQEKALEDCTDEELKAFIKRETGEGVRGNPSRDTLLKRAAEIAEKAAA